MRVVQVRLSWAKEQRPLKTVTTDVKESIPLMHLPAHPPHGAA
jgi:hypothetical protein